MNTNKVSIFLLNNIIKRQLFKYSYLKYIQCKNTFIQLKNVQFNIKEKAYLIDKNKFNFSLRNK